MYVLPVTQEVQRLESLYNHLVAMLAVLREWSEYEKAKDPDVAREAQYVLDRVLFCFTCAGFEPEEVERQIEEHIARFRAQAEQQRVA